MENQEIDDEIVWHYTTLGNLEKILSSNSLLATEAEFQNDPVEAIFPEKLLRESIERVGVTVGGGRLISDDLEHWTHHINPLVGAFNQLLGYSRFILSASKDGDNLLCWRTYAAIGEVGCAIGLDANVKLGLPGGTSAGWETVIYQGEPLENDIDLRLTQAKQKYDLACRQSTGKDEWDAALLCLFFDVMEIRSHIFAVAKSSSYSGEKESRITISDPPANAVIFGAGRAGPRPRVALFSHENPSANPGTRLSGALPMVEVRLGPTAPDESTLSLRWLLAAHGYGIDGAEVSGSTHNEQGEEEYHFYIDQRRRVEISKSKHLFRHV